MKNSIIFCILLIVAGCFAHRQETVQKDSASFLSFAGNVNGADFILEQDGEVKYPQMLAKSGKRYRIIPGVYLLTVFKRGRVIAKRKLFFVDGETREVHVP